MADEKPFDFGPGGKEEFLQRANDGMVGAIPYNTALKLRVMDLGTGMAVMKLPYRPEFVGNPDTGVLHGGAVTGLLDATCGLSVFLRLADPTRIATLDLRIDYLRPATPGKDVCAKAECYKLGRQVAFVRATAYHDDPGDAIASAAGTFIIFDEGSSPIAEAMKQEIEKRMKP